MTTAKPSFPSQESSLLWVPWNRALGWKMLASGGGLVAFSIYSWVARAHPMVPLLAVMIGLGGLIALIGSRILLRRTPVIAADERGLFVSVTGSDTSLLPWEFVSGADVVGKAAAEELVILTEEIDGALAHVQPTLAQSARSKNRKYGRPGAAYLLGRFLGRPAREVAMEIRGLLGETDRTQILCAGSGAAVAR